MDRSRDIPIGHKTSGVAEPRLEQSKHCPKALACPLRGQKGNSSVQQEPQALSSQGDLGYGDREQDGKALSRFIPCREAQE